MRKRKRITKAPALSLIKRDLLDTQQMLRQTSETIAEIETNLQRALDDEEWRRIDEIRIRLESPIIAEMDLIFEEQKRDALVGLDQFRGMQSTRGGFLSLDALFSVPRWFEDTWARLKDFFFSAIVQGYNTGADQMDIDLPDLTSFDPAVREQLEVMAARTKKITETTASDLAQIIDDALRGGWSIDKTADEISMKFDQYTGSRSKLIAQTNVTGAFGKGQLQAFIRAGLDKRWLSQRDGRVRETHILADGQEQEAGNKFVVGRALLRFPGDPETDHFEEVANCRCAMLPVRKR